MEDPKKPAIVLSGNIAAGKSTLAEALGEALALPVRLENASANPFLESPSEMTLQTELWFLANGLEAYGEVTRRGGVIERHPSEHVDVFARVKRDRGWLSDEEWQMLERLRRHGLRAASPPDLLILLEVRPATALERLAARGHRGDELLQGDYLTELAEAYSEFIGRWSSCPVLRIDTDCSDLRAPHTFECMLERIRGHLDEFPPV
jgi:deoxyadenosine/deoxycytidine kinase